MRIREIVASVFVGIALFGGCDGGGSGGAESGDFRLIQFLDNNRDDVDRNPGYESLAGADILAHVSANQRIRVYASSARPDAQNPLVPDITTEIPLVEVALVRHQSGATTVDITGDIGALNPLGVPARDAFVRVEAHYEYDNGVEAVTGPFAYIDRVDLTISVNG